jgi:predicted aldo/keto reductase-like oxidoreductase
MKRVVLGKTGLEVNQLGLGGIPIQRVDEAQAVNTVLHALQRGVDFIDTARGYSTSERRIGMALKQTDKTVIVASKSKSRTSEGILTDIEISLKELQMEYMHIYQCHFVKDGKDYNQVVSAGGALEGLVRAKEEGLIGHIGLTTHSLDLLNHVIEDGLFETIMVCFSFLEPEAREKIIPKAIKKDVGVLAMKPFSGGVIENARLALKYVLSHPRVVVIAGVDHKNLFDENWEIFQSGEELNNEEMKQIDEMYKHYDKNFCRRCDYCQPCTEEIPIQIILHLRSMVKRAGRGIKEKSWLQEAIRKARNCTECGECMTRCPYELHITDFIKENLQWIDEDFK